MQPTERNCGISFQAILTNMPHKQKSKCQFLKSDKVLRFRKLGSFSDKVCRRRCRTALNVRFSIVSITYAPEQFLTENSNL
jgi:hypothetical protein